LFHSPGLHICAKVTEKSNLVARLMGIALLKRFFYGIHENHFACFIFADLKGLTLWEEHLNLERPENLNAGAKWPKRLPK
jgi:hypothetical protein